MLFHVVAVIFVLYQILRFLRVFEATKPPTLHHSDSGFIKDIIRKCPSLKKTYTPVSIWGKCGHIQTAVYGKIGRFMAPIVEGERHSITLHNGDTVTYDIYEARESHVYKGDYTILLCPGIANSSEKAYIRTFIKYAIENGFRIAVLNHIGALSNVKLTTPRIFTYGDTQYFGAMVDRVMKDFPESKFCIVGFSMGGNIAIKYLGEDIKRQQNIMCAVSLCQGYDAIRSTVPLSTGYRRFYNHMVTLNMKKILRPHWNEIFKNENSTMYDENKIKSARFLHDIEDGLLRHFGGFESVQDYMDKASCSHVIHNVKLPVLLFNTTDDPLIVNDVHDIPKEHSEKNENSIFVTTNFGGHLGCYTGNWNNIDPLTFLEPMIIEYLNAVIHSKNLIEKCK